MQTTRSLFWALGLLCLAVSTGATAAAKTQDPRTRADVHKKPRPASVQRPARAASAVQPALPPAPVALGPQELLIAERVYTGHLPCELGQAVELQLDTRSPGYFKLHGQGFRYHLRPVTSRTGTIRLEDEKAGAVWLQLADKSMLMDQKRGRRLADACAHPEQVAFAADMKNKPLPALFDAEAAGRED